MKIILGSGIAGLIYAYYHPNYIIIGDNIGGQMNACFDLGPRYLHNSSPKIIKFLNELEVPFTRDIVKIGYIDDSGFVDSPDQEFREHYFMKSRNQTNLDGFDSTVMNCNKSEFEVLKIDFKKLVSSLYMKISDRLYSDRVTRIDLKNNTIYTNTMQFRYDSLISSIPLDVFFNLSGLRHNLKAFDMSYYLVDHLTDCFNRYDYVYDCRTETEFHRMTRCNKGIVLDFFGAKDSIDIINFKKQNLVVVKNAQIISLQSDYDFNTHIDSVKFIGRYGCWNRQIKTETIIEEAQNE